MKSLISVVALSALGLCASAQAETVFKWVDANGVTTYSTTPPPSSMRKVSAINAAPAVSGQAPAGLTSAEEAAYWKRQRDVAEDIRASRQNRETEDLKQQLLRQQIASIYDEEQRRKAEEQRRQDAYNRCVFERRTDCDVNGNPVVSSYGGTTVGVRRRPQSITSAAPFPVAGSPAVTNPTPGAPSLSVSNPTPGAYTGGSASARPATTRSAAAAMTR